MTTTMHEQFEVLLEQDGDHEFPATTDWEGWVERPIPSSWVSAGQLDLTVRFWNARIDAMEVLVDAPTTSRHTTWGAVKAKYLH